MLDEQEEPVATEEDDGATATADETPEGGAEDTAAEVEAEAPAEAAVEAEAPDEPEAEVEAPAEAEAEAPADEEIGLSDDDDDEEKSIEPEVQEFIDQDSTVVHTKDVDDDSPVPTEFRTPPGVPSGLDPGTSEERDVPPRPPS